MKGERHHTSNCTKTLQPCEIYIHCFARLGSFSQFFSNFARIEPKFCKTSTPQCNICATIDSFIRDFVCVGALVYSFYNTKCQYFHPKKSIRCRTLFVPKDAGESYGHSTLTSCSIYLPFGERHHQGSFKL